MRTVTLVILLLLTSLARAEERKTVVLLPLVGPAGAEGETVAEAARDLLAAAISRPGGSRLVDREALDRVLGEQELVARSSPDAAHLGNLLGATHAVKGTAAGGPSRATSSRIGSAWPPSSFESRGSISAARLAAASRSARFGLRSSRRSRLSGAFSGALGGRVPGVGRGGRTSAVPAISRARAESE